MGQEAKALQAGARRTVLTAVAIAALCLPPVSLSERRARTRRGRRLPHSFSAATAKPATIRASTISTPAQSGPGATPEPESDTASRISPIAAAGTQASGRAEPYAPQAGARGVYHESGLQRFAMATIQAQLSRLYAPPGHLGAWLNTHRNVPVPQQQQMLRNDPEFSPATAGRTTAGDEPVEPGEPVARCPARTETGAGGEPGAAVPGRPCARGAVGTPVDGNAADRQTMMRNAFRDLRAVPPDQRSIVLNSSRYQGQFSPEERGILSDMLRVEPYAPPQ